MLQVDPFLGIRVRRILSNLSSLISPLTHVYQRRDPRGYLGNQTGSVGGQGFQVLLLSSLCFPLVALQEQTQQQQRLITRWCQRLKWPRGPHWLMWMRFGESWCDCVTWQCALWWKTYQIHSLHSYEVKGIWPSAWCCCIWIIYFFKMSRMKCQESLCAITWKWSLKYYGALRGVRSCLSFCVLLFSLFLY